MLVRKPYKTFGNALRSLTQDEWWLTRQHRFSVPQEQSGVEAEATADTQ